MNIYSNFARKNHYMKTARYLQTLGSFRNYYRSMNEILVTAFGKIHMLHYPFYMKDNETLEERQQNLIEYCLSHIGDLTGKDLLEVGCGNGLNCHYIDLKWKTRSIIGIDLNQDNLEIARMINKDANISFIHDNAQELASIPDHSIDVLICIESAFHYPDKHAFFKQISRVLRTDGVFLIVDILSRTGYRDRLSWLWKRHKLFFHANEEQYVQFSSANNLTFQKTENITDRIIRGYAGYRSWVRRERTNLMNYLLLKFFAVLMIQFNIMQLKTSKQYMLFYGRHTE